MRCRRSVVATCPSGLRTSFGSAFGRSSTWQIALNNGEVKDVGGKLKVNVVCSGKVSTGISEASVRKALRLSLAANYWRDEYLTVARDNNGPPTALDEGNNGRPEARLVCKYNIRFFYEDGGLWVDFGLWKFVGGVDYVCRTPFGWGWRL